jgi:hypothetical protein
MGLGGPSANYWLKAERCLPARPALAAALGACRASKTHQRATAPRLGDFSPGPQSRLDVASPA